MGNRWTVYDNTIEHSGMNFRKFPRTSGIYQIVNTLNQKRYVGYATNLRLRCKCHRVELRVNDHKNLHLQNAWNVYGERYFEFLVLQECSIAELPLYEDYWAKVLKVHDREYGYNIKPTDPLNKYIHSEETKKRIGLANKGKYTGNVGNKNPFYGKTHTEETIKKLRDVVRGKDYSNHRTCNKKIIDSNTGIIYDSLTHLAKVLNADYSWLCRKLTGKVKNNTSYSYI